jgi:2'-5' RNA ligase
MMSGADPTLLYRTTGRLNRVIWRLPLPHRVVALLSSWAYRNPPMPGDAVLVIVEALRDAGVRCWISGGWGVDALAGEHTRVHRDLDLVVEDRGMDQAVEILDRLGYFEWHRSESEVPMFSRVVLHDHELAGRTIDLHPLELAGTHMEFTTGEIGGREVPCLSVDLQVKTHSSYRKRWSDRNDLAILRKLREGSGTTLILPVPSLDSVVQESARESGIPAHITLLYPFLAGRSINGDTESALASLLLEIPAFDFVLSEIGRFPGVVYLAPEPAEHFVALTEALVGRWPERQPYGGDHQEIIPHLTVAYGAPIPDGLVEQLPLAARAEEVWLMRRTEGRWVRCQSFPLGSLADPSH